MAPSGTAYSGADDTDLVDFYSTTSADPAKARNNRRRALQPRRNCDFRDEAWPPTDPATADVAAPGAHATACLGGIVDAERYHLPR